VGREGLQFHCPGWQVEDTSDVLKCGKIETAHAKAQRRKETPRENSLLPFANFAYFAFARNWFSIPWINSVVARLDSLCNNVARLVSGDRHGMRGASVGSRSGARLWPDVEPTRFRKAYQPLKDGDSCAAGAPRRGAPEATGRAVLWGTLFCILFSVASAIPR